VSYGRIQRYDLAEEAFKKALSIKKTDVYAMNNLAILYLETGRLDEAAEYGNMAVRTEPNYANGHLTLGSIYATAGDLDRAETEFAKALELDPASGAAKANIEKLRTQKSQGGDSRPGR
jgi:Flp pilus assembly protein TadD